MPLQEAAGENLVVFHETVVKSVTLDEQGKKIRSLIAIQRSPRSSLVARGYDLLPSQDLADWYSPDDSQRFTKRVLKFCASAGKMPVFIEATEWGEVLALSGADYLQGAEIEEQKKDCLDTAGQSTVYCFVQEIHDTAQTQPEAGQEVEHLGYGDYQEKPNAWDLIWTYRRIGGEGPPAVGDLCLQNWGYSPSREQGGNDYPFGYLFLSKDKTAASVDDWRGGINLETLAAAEARAYGWHHWFRKQAPEKFSPENIALNGRELGTAHGLAKLPYIRDTRRSIGLDDFVLQFASLSGPASQVTGEKFPDRIALGSYAADIHPLTGKILPEYLKEAHDTLPFYIPFRALTHYQF
ncbi:MAG: FAD-dependent oxidoreductase, partial [Lacipirellulaceae bacterium]